LTQELELCKKSLSTKHEATKILLQQVCMLLTCIHIYVQHGPRNMDHTIFRLRLVQISSATVFPIFHWVTFAAVANDSTYMQKASVVHL